MSTIVLSSQKRRESLPRDIETFKRFCEKLGGEVHTDINLGTIVMKCIFRNPSKVRKLYA